MLPRVSFVTTSRGELLLSPIVSSHSRLTALEAVRVGVINNLNSFPRAIEPVSPWRIFRTGEATDDPFLSIWNLSWISSAAVEAGIARAAKATITTSSS
jgi:hypothetical protein